MATLAYTKLVKTNLSTNENKWWSAEVTDDGTYKTLFGRNGAECSKPCIKPFGDTTRAMKEYDKNVADKKRNGYKEFQGVNPQGTAGTVVVTNGSVIRAGSTDIKSIGLSEIESDTPDTKEVIRYLLDRNAWDIQSKTSLTYNATTGLYSTPHGVVTASAIAEARQLLNNIGGYVEQYVFNDPQLEKWVNEYLMLVPKDFGRTRMTPRDLLPNINYVKSENSLLDQLESSISMMTAPTVTPGGSRTFDAKLYELKDMAELLRLSKLYDSTLNRMHQSSYLRIKKVFRVEIGHMKTAYDACNIGNVMEAWHGTKDANLASILAKGMMIIPSTSKYVTGRMFGDGIYTSDQVSKATNYSVGYAPGQARGGTGNRFFVFLCDVRLGNAYTPRSAQSSGWKPPAGYDSCFAKGGVSGVANNELVVYHTRQINPKYLIELSD